MEILFGTLFQKGGFVVLRNRPRLFHGCNSGGIQYSIVVWDFGCTNGLAHWMYRAMGFGKKDLHKRLLAKVQASIQVYKFSITGVDASMLGVFFSTETVLTDAPFLIPIETFQFDGPV